MAHQLEPTETSGILAAVARKSVPDGVTNPGDIAYAMTQAIEAATVTLEVLHGRGVLEWSNDER